MFNSQTFSDVQILLDDGVAKLQLRCLYLLTAKIFIVWNLDSQQQIFMRVLTCKYHCVYPHDNVNNLIVLINTTNFYILDMDTGIIKNVRTQYSRITY